MNWEAIGAIGDLISGVAVLVTLIYLATQIRQAKNLMASNAHQVRTDRNIALMHFTANDPQSLERSIGTLNVEALKPDELLRASLALAATLRHFEDMQYQYELGVVDEETSKANLRGIRRIITPPSAQALWPHCQDMFREPFVRLVNSVIAGDA